MKKLVQLSILSALAIIIFSVENIIPNPVPMIRIGLANVITLVVLCTWGLSEAAEVVLLKIVAGNLLTGRLFSPLFTLSLCGSIAATLVMALMLYRFSGFFSLVGISIAGAAAHNSAQIIAARFLFIKSIPVLSLIPLFILSSVVTGAIVGAAAVYSVKIIKKHEVFS